VQPRAEPQLCMPKPTAVTSGVTPRLCISVKCRSVRRRDARNRRLVQPVDLHHDIAALAAGPRRILLIAAGAPRIGDHEAGVLLAAQHRGRRVPRARHAVPQWRPGLQRRSRGRQLAQRTSLLSRSGSSSSACSPRSSSSADRPTREAARTRAQSALAADGGRRAAHPSPCSTSCRGCAFRCWRPAC